MASLIQEYIALADKNWFGTGGCARYYSEPHTSAEFQQALLFAQQQNIDVFILGSGANILISDEGFDGLVIKPQLLELSINEQSNTHGLLSAGAGVAIDALIEYMLQSGYASLEEFSGIPGTVGGAVFINIHFFNFLLADFIVSAQVIHRKTGAILTVDKTWFNFGYNKSTLQEKEYYLISVTFLVRKISHDEVMFARGRKHEIIRYRSVRYPTAKTCGSFFRNFLEHEVTLESNGKKMIYVAYYLDKLGVKGTLQKGNALVSHQHANMIVAKNSCTSSDIIALASTMQQMVFDTFGILPETECQLVGFKKYPLGKKGSAC